MKTKYALNRKAFYDYEILEQVEAGMVLTGPEVKSIRDSRINLKGSWVHISEEILLKNCHIQEYKNGYKYIEQDPLRSRALLLSTKQRKKFKKSLEQEGTTLIVLEVYQPENSKKIKCLLALCKGKNKSDKRNSIKDRELKIEAQKTLKELNA